MGFIKDAKQGAAAGHASRAVSEGHSIFLYRFDVPATSGGFSGPISGAAEVIEGIEREGWTLAEMAYDRAQSKNGAVLLLFRRTQAAGGQHRDLASYVRNGQDHSAVTAADRR